MSSAADLSIKYADALRGFGASLPDDFAAAATGVEEQLTEEQLERWAAAGIALTRHSLRSWEAAAEYFRASPRMVRLVDFDDVMRWVELGTALSDRSSLMAAAFLKAAPDVMGRLPADQLEAWSQQGERLCRGNWKSIALSSLYFSGSARLLDSFSLPSLDRLVDVVEVLTERSYELATTCLESSGDIFAALAIDDREPFLAFARAVTRASWADTRLYFERGPKLIESIDPAQRATFLELAARVTTEVGRQGFPLFSEAAQAVGEIPPESHAVMLSFASRLAGGSPTAAMEYLKSAPFIATRLTSEQMEQWAAAGLEILEVEHNAEGAEAFFRFESTRAEEMLAALSARLELSAVGNTLRLYAKALTGEQVAVLSSENLVDRGIGWVSEGAATTEGTAIYLPPYVNTFPEQKSNFQVYKVFTTHQTGRMEFGSFRYVFGPDGAHTTSTAASREAERAAAAEAAAGGDTGGDGDEAAAVAVSTEIQRYFNLFPDRLLISALFTVVEDTRVDACVAREYGGIRSWLRRLQAYEAGRRPDVRAMGLRQAFIENLLRASLGRTETILWPQQFQDQLLAALAALKIVEQDGASVQDSAEVAASLYDIAIAIRNVAESAIEGDWIGPDEEMISVGPMMPGGEGEGGEPQLMPNNEEIAFETPPQPEFRGDFKPELVQLLTKLKLQQEGQQDGISAPLTKEQLMELLENSVEVTISDWAEGDLASSLGMFLDNLEKEGGTPAGDPKNKKEGEGGEEGDTPGPGDGEDELEVKIEWTYYDEWDFRANDYRPRWTRVGERMGELGELDFYEDVLQRHHGLVMETRRQFELMRPESFRKIKRLEDGDDIDIDQAIEFYIDKKAGVGPLARFYTRRNKVERDVAVAFLLDMSASTDEEIEKQRPKYDSSDDDEEFNDDPRKYFQWLAQRRARQAVEPPKRIIDLEKEASVLIVEALEAIGDAYGIYGFSGYGRENVEFHVIKDLDERFDDDVRRRIDKIEPIRSTRMGPAIRHTISKLNDYDAKVKILILVSDGRPQDHGYGRDRTEKEYAVHDTKQALNEAKRDGITPFLITVDKEGHDYLKQMCDDIGYEVVSDIESLPRRLPSLYKALAAD